MAFKGKMFIADEPLKGLRLELDVGERIVVNDTLNITVSTIVNNTVILMFEGDKEAWHVVRGQLTGNTVDLEGNNLPQKFKNRGRSWKQTK